MSQMEIKHRTAKHIWGDIILQSVHTRPFEAQVYRNRQCVEIAFFISIAVDSPDFFLSEVQLAALHRIKCSYVDAETYARKHHFTLHTCLRANDTPCGNQILLEFQIADVDADRRPPPELCPGSKAANSTKQQKHYDFLKFFHSYKSGSCTPAVISGKDSVLSHLPKKSSN